jgi:hypothetical protein
MSRVAHLALAAAANTAGSCLLPPLLPTCCSTWNRIQDPACTSAPTPRSAFGRGHMSLRTSVTWSRTTTAGSKPSCWKGSHETPTAYAGC